MQIAVSLWSVLALLAVALGAVWLSPHRVATPLVYTSTALISAILCVGAFLSLGAAPSAVLRLPLGLPWVGANFHIDALSSLFLVVVNLGGIGASIYAIGYGRHEVAPKRVLPFFPAFLAGMNLVVLSDDAFTFLLSWEFMSLTSWALVVAHHRLEDNVRAGYVYTSRQASAHSRCCLRSVYWRVRMDTMALRPSGPVIQSDPMPRLCCFWFCWGRDQRRA